MHRIPRGVLRIGSTIFALGLLVVMFGGTVIDNVDTPPESEDWSGTLMFKGETPTTYEVELNIFSSYYVFVQEGANITVEILNGNDDNYFEPCENDDDCDIYDIEGNISGYEYIGEILIDDKGEYDIVFTEESGEAVEVMIREDRSFQSFLIIAGGSVGCFVGLLLLIIGGIMAKMMKESIEVDLSSGNEDNTMEIVEEKEGGCDRCGKAIEFRSDAVICTHFGSLPTISHQECAQRNFAHAPSVGLKFGVRFLPFFLIVNVLNFLIGVIALSWGLVELTQPQDANAYTPTFPIGLMMGPFMIVIGGVLVARINHLSKRVPTM